MNVRPPRGEDERIAARSVCDAAMLELPEDPAWLVASETPRVSDASGERRDPRAADGRVLGSLALRGEEIAAVAVRPGRRGQGVGTALVEGAGERRDRLVAEFDASVRSFYETLGFEVEPLAGDRYRGVLQ